MTCPGDYIANQYRVNLAHSNGVIDTDTEEALLQARWLRQEIEEMQLMANSILDAGCRSGYTLPLLDRLFGKATGCDIVPEFVAIANTRGEAVEADIHALPFKDREFDWVMCTGTLEHCYDTSKAVSELFRVANVGVFITADMQSQEAFDGNPSHYVRHDTPEEWLALIKAEGWHLASLEVPSHTFIHGIWVRSEHFKYIVRGMDWYRKRVPKC